MNIRWVPTLIGLAIAFALLALITKISIFGVTCYAIGEVNLFGNMRCLHPAVYWGAWVVAIILILIGIRVPMPGPSSSSPSSSPSSEPAAPSSGFESHDAGAKSVAWRRVVAVLVVIGIVGLLIAGYVIYNIYSADRTTEVAPAPDTPQPQAEAPLPQPSPPAIGPDGLPVQPTPPSPQRMPSTEPPPPAIGPDGLPILTPSQPPSSALPVPGQYRWSGRATTPDGRNLGLAVVFDPSGNAGIEWADLKCGGTLTFVRATGPSFAYVERITYGALDCMPTGTVTMTPIENGAAIEFQKDLGASKIVAQLRPF